MMRFLFFLIFFILLAFSSQGQDSNPIGSDSLVYYQFVGGKPYFEYVKAKEEVLRKLGFSVETILAGCVGPFEPEASQYRIKNKPAFERLESLLGDDWKVKLNARVEERLDRRRK